MPSITSPLSLYEGLLTLATPSERAAIINAGPRENLDNNLFFGTDETVESAHAAYDAIKAIVSRVSGDRTLRITGIDSRAMPPRREIVEAEVMLTGRLMWEGPSGVESKLQLEWTNPTGRIINLRVEPAEQPAMNVPLSMSPPGRLAPGERIDDTERLRRMQEFIDTGLPPKTAARHVAVEMPSPPTGEASLTTRLVRKFKLRVKT